MLNETEISMISAVIGGIVGGFISSYFMWLLQKKDEKKNIARALYSEISSLEGHLRVFSGMFKNPPPGVNHDAPIEINQALYTDYGLYFSFRKEISSFNEELSKNLFDFYIYLLRADEFRKIEKSSMFFKPANDEMKTNIVKAYELLPHLKKLIEKEFGIAEKK